MNQLDKKTILIFLIIISFFILPQFYLWDHITDDAYISFRYAERLLEGKGLTFNDGEKVEGFSNPLWIFILALSSKITTIEIPTLARILGFMFSNLVILFILLITKILFDKSKANLLLIFISSIIFFTPGFHVYSTGGLEVSLFSFLITSVTYFSISESKNHLIIAAILAGFLGICRPEGSLYILLWLILTYKFDKQNIFSYLSRIIIAIIPSIIYVTFRLYYYGEILPNTAYAKPAGTYSYLFGIDDSFLFLTILSIPLTIIVTYYYFKFSVERSNIFITISGFLLSNLIFLIYAGGDWMLLGRFFLPVWPIILIAFSYLLLNFLSAISSDSFTFKYLSYLSLISIIISQLLLFKEQWFEYKSNNNIANVMKGEDQLNVGIWINDNIQQNSTVATFRLGGISYGAPKLIFYDTFGLTDKEVTNYRREKRINYDVNENPVIKRKPNILAIINDNGYRMITLEPMKGWEEFLEKNYIFIKSFPQGLGFSFEIWVDKNETEKILVNTGL
jgi:hypothetical protein